MPNCASKPRSFPTEFSHCDRDAAVLVRFQFDNELDNLVHGPVPDILHLARPSACGSARFGAQPAICKTGPRVFSQRRLCIDELSWVSALVPHCAPVIVPQLTVHGIETAIRPARHRCRSFDLPLAECAIEHRRKFVKEI